MSADSGPLVTDAWQNIEKTELLMFYFPLPNVVSSAYTK